MKVANRIDNLAKARASWGDEMPDWVEALALACNGSTQTATGRRIGYSGAVISQVLSNTYHLGDMEKVEAMVRGALMATTVLCPGSGDTIGRDVCMGWQSRPFSTSSANSVRMFNACRAGCSHSRLTARGDE